ncbi:hypothetical protein DYB28_008519, partial [Aphanomyces astaci]
MSTPATRPLTVVTPETATAFIATIAARIKDFKIAAISSTTDTKEAQPQRNNVSRHADRPQRPQRNTPSRQHNVQVTEVNSDTDDSEDDVEEVILGNNMDLAQQDSGEEESLDINTAQKASKVPARENMLMIIHGALDSTSVRILIDSGTSNLLGRPGLAKTVIRSKEVQAEGFDGHCSGIKKGETFKWKEGLCLLRSQDQVW